MNALLTFEFWKFAIPVFGATLAWLFNQWRERSREEYLRKEKLYRALVDAMQGFYQQSPTSTTIPFSTTLVSAGIEQTTQRRQEFLDQLRLAWLYCPNKVIRKAYAFLDTVHAEQGSPVAHGQAELAFGEVIAAIRRDLLPSIFLLWRRTKLSGADYRHLRVNV